MYGLELIPESIIESGKSAALEAAASTMQTDVNAIAEIQAHVWALYLAVGWKLIFLTSMIAIYFIYSQTPVYLLDFAVFQCPEEWQVSHKQILDITKRSGQKLNPDKPEFTEETLDFLERLQSRSATSQKTHWPPGLTKLDPSMANARLESETVLFGCVGDALEKTGLKPKDIDILIVNCSLFVPTPSLCAMISNKFKMRHDLESYNLGGMGCSAGVISIHLAKQLLQAKPNSRALVVSTENLTQNMYMGNERRFLVQNTLFRCGGAAIVLSNKWLDGYRAKYKLLHTVRHQYADDESYECVYEAEDELGNKGVRLSKQITHVAGRALKHNLTT